MSLQTLSIKQDDIDGEDLVRSMDRTILKYEKRFIRSMSPLFRRQFRIIDKILNSKQESQTLEIARAIQVVPIEPVLVDFTTRVMIEGYATIVNIYQYENLLTTQNPIYVEIRKRARQTARDLNKSTMNKVSRAIANNNDTSAVKRFLTTTARPMLIAKTEGAYIINQSSLQAFEDNGIEKTEWYTNQDNRVCQWCPRLHGKIFKTKRQVLSAGRFRGLEGGELPIARDINSPPIHSGCRCRMLPRQ